MSIWISASLVSHLDQVLNDLVSFAPRFVAALLVLAAFWLLFRVIFVENIDGRLLSKVAELRSAKG